MEGCPAGRAEPDDVSMAERVVVVEVVAGVGVGVGVGVIFDLVVVVVVVVLGLGGGGCDFSSSFGVWEGDPPHIQEP